MRQYQIKRTEELKKETSKIICNQCGKEIPVVAGQEQEGVFSIEYTWGYFSEKDGEKHRFDLCEECYDAMLKGFRVPAEIQE